MKRSVLPLATLAIAVSLVPLRGGPIIFSDLGAGGNVYNSSSNSWGILGSANSFSPGLAEGIAALFTAQGNGSEVVSQIDLGVWQFSGLHTFTGGIWTDVSGNPGAQVPGAFWSLVTNNTYPGCCTLVTVSGIL